MLVIVMALTFGLAISCSESSDCPTKTCGSFSTQAQAQSTYDSDRSCYKNLDSDGDGIACENLQKK
ncbi:calcium-binding protein [Flavobacterium hercynium]|uniref:Calcium-binding protein n=2 Tax=Flavobacterium hercynium TaxID=387094 RepID=A0A226HAS5_9FLAO|nr:calcium-binding protein [Flavobacterium hercynium]